MRHEKIREHNNNQLERAPAVAFRDLMLNPEEQERTMSNRLSEGTLNEMESGEVPAKNDGKQK